MDKSTEISPAAGDEKIASDNHVSTIEHVNDVNANLTRTDSHLDQHHVILGWRTWLVVAVIFFG